MFLNSLKKINWLSIYGKSSIEQQFKTFINLFNTVVDFGYPLETKVIEPNVTRSNENSEVNSGIQMIKKNLKVICDKFFYLSKNSKNTNIRQSYTNLKYQYRIAINKAKLKYNNKLISEAVNRPKQILKIINNNIGCSKNLKYSIKCSVG